MEKLNLNVEVEWGCSKQRSKLDINEKIGYGQKSSLYWLIIKWGFLSPVGAVKRIDKLISHVVFLIIFKHQTA